MIAPPTMSAEDDRTLFLHELEELGERNWTGNLAESVFRLRSLSELSTGRSTAELIELTAELEDPGVNGTPRRKPFST